MGSVDARFNRIRLAICDMRALQLVSGSKKTSRFLCIPFSFEIGSGQKLQFLEFAVKSAASAALLTDALVFAVCRVLRGQSASNARSASGWPHDRSAIRNAVDADHGLVWAQAGRRSGCPNHPSRKSYCRSSGHDSAGWSGS